VSDVTLFLPFLLPPGSDIRPPRLPLLERLIARGRFAQSACGDSVEWLCRRFAVARQDDWPAAAIALAGEGLDPKPGYWLCADPVHLRVHGDELILEPPWKLEPTPQEADSLVAELNRHFGPDGLVFRAPHPRRWYLGTATPPSLRTVSLESATGRNVNALLPDGPDGLAFRRILNEVQMLLHRHPVNQQREDNGRPMLNSLWLWGGGILPRATAQWTCVAGANPLLAGLARLAGIRSLPLESPDALPDEPRLLVMPTAEPAADGWEQHILAVASTWIDPLIGKLAAGRLSSLTIGTLANGQALEWKATRSDLRKFWRRPRPLATP
jgi:hypothetical protein